MLAGYAATGPDDVAARLDAQPVTAGRADANRNELATARNHADDLTRSQTERPQLERWQRASRT